MSQMKDRHRKLARERFWSENNRATYECPDCGRIEPQTTGFEIHHKNGNAHDNRVGNLVGLCRYCHCLREDRKPPMSAIEQMRSDNAADQQKQLENPKSGTCPECGEKHPFCPLCRLPLKSATYAKNGSWEVEPNIPEDTGFFCADWTRDGLYLYFHPDQPCQAFWR